MIHLEDKKLAKEIANRNLETEPERFMELCDSNEFKDWCEGYFSAVITSNKLNNKLVCIPTNDIGRYSYNGVWTLTKSWLYRHKDKTTFYSAISNAITESDTCGK